MNDLSCDKKNCKRTVVNSYQREDGDWEHWCSEHWDQRFPKKGNDVTVGFTFHAAVALWFLSAVFFLGYWMGGLRFQP